MKNRYLKDSFKHASHGIYQGIKTERNLKTEAIIGAIVLMVALMLKVKPSEWAVLLLTIGFVLVTELLNTAIEYTVDMVCGDQYHELAKYAKDIAAGATLLASLTAVAVGLFIFIPHMTH